MCIRGNSFAPVSTILPLYIAAVLLNRLMYQKTIVYSLLAISIKYISYFHRDKIRICLRGLDGCFEREISKLEKF
jgi:hypothetical protein